MAFSPAKFIAFGVMVLLLLLGVLYLGKQATPAPADTSLVPHYRDMMEDPSVNVYDVIRAGNEWFADRDRGKGSGYKQFQRWILLNEDRFYPTGDRSNYNPALPYEVYKGRATTTDNVLGESTFGAPMPTSMALNAWEEIGPAEPLKKFYNDDYNGNGRVDAIWVNPSNENQIYVGNRGGGFWTTDDGGTTWIPRTDFLGITGVYTFAVDPTDPDNVYIATSVGGAGNYSIGVFYTDDGGASWTPTNYALDIAADRLRIEKLLIHPTNPLILYAATRRGLVRTDDGFQTWTKVINSDEISDVEFKPGDPSVVYATNDDDRTLYRSTDNGLNFLPTSLTTPTGDLQVAVSAAAPENVYVVSDNYFTKSTNSGVDWTPGGSPDAGEGQYGGFGVSDTDPDLIINGSLDTYRSDDGGATFTKVTEWVYFRSTGINGNFVHADIREVEVVNGKVYLGTDGWLVRSDDGGLNYNQLTFSMGNHELYRHGIGVSQADDNTVVIGTQDNGTSIWYDGAWRHWRGGDGGTSVADHATQDILYGSLFNGDFIRTDDAAATNARTDLNDTKAGGLPPMVQHPKEPGTLFLGEGNGQIWKSTDRGNNWSVLYTLPVSDVLDELAIAPSDPDVIYASVKERLFRTVDGGSVWSELTGPWPNRVIHGIAVDYDDPDHVAITMSSYDAGQKVYESFDGGGGWANISGSLPNLNTNDIVFHNSVGDDLFVATDAGVYHRDAMASDWSMYGSGLPNVVANDLEIQHHTGYLYVATWGRGVWRVLTPPGKITPVADFTSDVTSIDLGGTVTFTDQSQNTPTSWSWHFPGGTPEFSTDQHPTVTYDTQGLYEVILTAMNANGCHTSAKIDYVEVINAAPLKAAYAFEDLTDGSTFNRTLTVNGTEAYEAGPCEMGFSFNGSTYLTIPGYQGPIGDTPRSVAAWIKTTADGPIVSWGGTSTGNRFTFRIDGGQLRVEIAGGYIRGTATVDDGAWHHVAFTFSDDAPANLNNVLFYVDGVLDPESAGNTSTLVNTTAGNDVRIGDYPFGSEFVGAMDELQIHERVLSPQEVSDLANPGVFCSALPVVFVDFTARLRGKVVELTWETALEEDNAGFRVERSAEGTQWVSIGQLPAGASATGQRYTFVDAAPLVGDNFYRIVQSDLDGSTTITPVRRVAIATPGTFTVAPNPAANFIRVSLPNDFELAELRLIDAGGREVSLGRNLPLDRVPLGNYPAGIYLLRVQSKGGEVLTKRIVLR